MGLWLLEADVVLFSLLEMTINDHQCRTANDLSVSQAGVQQMILKKTNFRQGLTLGFVFLTFE